MTGDGDSARLEASLRRIEELADDLDRLADAAAREHARELLERVLDLHGLGLARIITLIARAEGGADLLERLGQDEPVRAVLLLHGLHPEDLETRLRRAIAELRPAVVAELTGLSHRQARLRVTGADPALREAIEAALLEQAPDLEAIEIAFVQAHEEGAARVAAHAG